jgi:hypothetical protein
MLHTANRMLHDKVVLPIAKAMHRLQRRDIGIGLITASGVVLVSTVLFSLWVLNGENDSQPQTVSVLFEISVPQEVNITETFRGSTASGSPLELTGSTVAFAFLEGYLEAIDLPFSYSSGQNIASLSDASSGIYLEQDDTGKRTIRFPLLSTQEGMTMIITGTVEAVQTQDQGSRTRVSLSQMKATVNIPSVQVVQAVGYMAPSIAESQLVFELHRLPTDARLTMSRIDEFDVSTRSSIDSVLDETKGPWVAALSIEAKRINLDNGEDVGEASLYITLPNLEQRLLDGLIAVHVDEAGHAEQLVSEVVSTTGDETVIRFVSPRGLSIFTVMVPSVGLEATVTPAATSGVTPSSSPSPTSSATLAHTPTEDATPTPSPPTVATVPVTTGATATAMTTSVPSPTTIINLTPTTEVTITPTWIPTPTLSPTPTRTPLPKPTPVATVPGTTGPTATATATSVPSPTTISLTPTAEVTITPTGIPTPTPNPTPTNTPIPTPTRTPLPTPTTTPIPTPDEHYAAIVHTSDPVAQQWFLDTLDTKWFLDWNSSMDVIPSGHEKLITIGSLPGPSAQTIQDIVEVAPGSVWYIVGEPNRRSGYGATAIVAQLHNLYTAIKTADPTARITSPSILNWEFTCVGCGGFQNGREWVTEFRAEYSSQYGMEPPWDILAIDVYPLDWWTLPTVNAQLSIAQVNDMRAYLDSTELSDKPIWITELGVHWGYDSMLFPADEGYDISCGGLPQPTGAYQTQAVINYLNEVFNWLDANASSHTIEKWFLFTTYSNITTCNPSAYAGLTLFDGPDVGAALTEVGQFFKNRVLGISP